MRETQFSIQIGNKIREERKRKGMRQAELAKRCGITSATLSNIESGKTDCRMSIVGRLMDILNANLVFVTKQDVVFPLERT